MKVLFINDGYYPTPQASANCTRNIVNELINKHSVQCDIFNITTKIDVPEYAFDGSSQIYTLVDYHNVSIDDFKNAPMSLDKRCKIFICKLSERLFRCKIKRQKYKSIRKQLEKIASEYDVLVSVVSDFNIGYGTMLYTRKNDKPYILYQVDPISSNDTQKRYKKRLTAFEKKLYANAAYVFTTPLLKEEKKFDSSYDSEKIISAEFPIVVKPDTDTRKNHDGVVCFFAGNICPGVRDCRYTMKLFSLLNESDVFIEFVGAGQEDVVSSYASETLAGHVVHRGKLSKKECNSYMEQADILINIGNIMTNQVPSKIFDYISTGLPIINICTSKDCPTIPYMEKYGFALNLFETTNEEETKLQVESLRKFIHSFAGRRKPFEQVQMLFIENTPEYVGKQFIAALVRIEGDK